MLRTHFGLRGESVRQKWERAREKGFLCSLGDRWWTDLSSAIPPCGLSSQGMASKPRRIALGKAVVLHASVCTAMENRWFGSAIVTWGYMRSRSSWLSCETVWAAEQTVPPSPLSSINFFLLREAKFLQMSSSRNRKGSEAEREKIINYNYHSFPLTWLSGM